MLGLLPVARADLSNDPVVLFHTLADRLLREQFSFGVSNIPVAPTNEYSAVLHRILQVSANIADATRADRLPFVLRPLFNSNVVGVVTNVFVTGYTNDNQFSTYAAWLGGNPHSLPMVVSAKKGFPNFNEITMSQVIQATRRLQLTRPSTNAPPNATNQLYFMSISNLFAVENWNSSTSAYPIDLNLVVTNLSTVTLTSALGLIQTSSQMSGIAANLPANTWTGGQFRLPIYEQTILLTNSAYRFTSNTFDFPGTSSFETNIGYPLPSWILSVSNRLVYVLSEGGSIVDFVLLNNLTSTTDLQAELLSNNAYGGAPGVSPTINGVWKTNRVGGSSSVFAPTEGIRNQLHISLGNQNTTLSEWNVFSLQSATSTDKAMLIDDLRRFVGLVPFVYPNTPLPSDAALTTVAGFSPVAKMVRTTTWQANDPLIHYLPPDLLLFPTNVINQRLVPPSTAVPTNLALSTLGRLNTRYAPWGGNPLLNDPFSPFDPTAYSLTVKDSGVRQSDDWNFPTNQSLSVNWLGRVHRGTPWQTVYLKPDIASSQDMAALGLDMRVHPTNDWHLASLLVSLLNTGDPHQYFSINHPPAAWTTALDGVTVLSNSVPNNQLPIYPMQFDALLMSSNAPQAWLIANAVNTARSSRPGHYFRDMAEIFTVPQLSTASPWLNLSTGIQFIFGVNDEAYEMIPQQILQKLRDDPVGQISVIGNVVQLHFTVFPGYCYDIETSGDLQQWTLLQTLPAPNGLIDLTDPDGLSPGHRFYRAVLLPR